jgi:S1-C subfamily serine protease
LSAIPYNIISKTVDVGTDVFTLGYPLKTIMGDEIKLTNGIISSKTGFNGDITSYQISVPIQPGNSGGPLFDSDGNLIGIVNSVLRNAENVTYAIKSSYLNNLIETLPSGTKFFGNNIMRGQKLSSQSALAKSFVYQIEVN